MDMKSGILAVFTVTLLILTGFGTVVYGDNDEGGLGGDTGVGEPSLYGDGEGMVSEEAKGSILESFASSSTYFTENKGQFPDEVLFQAHVSVSGATVYLCRDKLVSVFTREVNASGENEHEDIMKDSVTMDRESPEMEVLSVVTRFVNASSTVVVAGDGLLPHRNNYFMGNDPSKWYVDVPNYQAVLYKNIYPGIDLRYYSHQGSLKYDFIAQPRADPSLIKLKYEGVENMELTLKGDLEIMTRFNDLFEKQPVIYQQREESQLEIPGGYEIMEQGVFGFTLQGGYDQTFPLIIDPELVYSTYLGGTNSEYGWGVAVDGAGNAIITGKTSSSDFPMVNPYDGTYNGGDCDVFVAKVSSTGNSLLYSTYLGGTYYDYGYGVAVDGSGNAIITGYTDSIDFPMVNPIDGTYNGGGWDSFIAKLSLGGSNPTASIYPISQTVAPGTTFCIEIHIDSDGVPVNSLGFNLTYPTSFTLTSFTYQNLLGSNVIQVGIPSVPSNSGLIEYGVSRMAGNPAAPINGNLATICFTAPSTPGNYPFDLLQVELIDDQGNQIPGVVVTDGTVTVTGGTPLEAQCYGPYSGLAGYVVLFTGSATGGTPPYSYAWDFDYDGYFTTDSNQQNPPWSFTTAGLYIVALRVMDDVGSTAMCTTTATITRPGGNDRPTCVIELQKNGNTISDIDVGVFFDIYVGDSTDDHGIAEVRFSSDEHQNGVPEGSWTKWYNWDEDAEDWTGIWDEDDKIKTWAFVTEGPREVWAEINDTDGLTHMASATIMSNSWFFVHITDPHVKKDNDGDWNSILQYLNSMNPPPDFILCSGDIVNHGMGWGGPQNFGEALNDLYAYSEDGILYIDPSGSIPIYFCPGNHDARYNSQLFPPYNFSNYYTYIGNRYNNVHPNYYNVTHKNCRIFVMNSGYDVYPWAVRPIDPPEGDGLYAPEYIDFRLEVARAQEDIKIVMIHHPYLGVNPSNPLDGTFMHFRAENAFIKECNDHGVGTILCGHVHDGGNTKIICGNTHQVITSAVKDGQWYRIVTVGVGERNYQEESMVSLKSVISGGSHCQVNVHIYDELGNHNGPNATGGIDWQIPESFYSLWDTGNATNNSNFTYTEFSLTKNDTKNYTFIFESLSNESMNVTFNTFIAGGEWARAVYTHVPMYNGSVGTTYANESVVNYNMEIVDPGKTTRIVTPSSISNNSSPEIDVISAPPQSIITSLEYSFTVNATDNNNDSIYFLFDWGDGNTSDWLGPYISGETCTANHSWNQDGSYVVTVQSKDDYSLIGNWSEGILVNVTGIDSVRITYDTEIEIPDMVISPNFKCVLSASAFNATSGFLQPIKVGWTVNNSGCIATINSTYGESVLLSSGPITGTITMIINDGYGHSDTVVFTVNASVVSSMFYEGWNLVTVPFDNMWTAEILGENISGCSVVTMFESSTQSFLTHVVGVPHDDFPIMDGVGYFVYCTRNGFLSVADVSIPGVNVIIHEDWNIIGWYHDYLTNAESLGGNISGCSVVIMFDAKTQIFLTHVVGVPHDNFTIEKGMGLFIYTIEASVWHGEG